MASLPVTVFEASARALPDYLPARMVNEFAYCPRLFFYEWVEGVFQESADTVEGAAQHRRVDEKATALPSPGQAAEGRPQTAMVRPTEIHARSVTLSSERLRAIAKMDLVEAVGDRATPVDYKHGAPQEGPDGLELWPADKAQLAVQGMILRDNGYQCDEGIVYYRKTGQRVRVALDAALVAETEALIAQAWAVAERGEIPAPLVDSPKCPGCSLVGICLPDETVSLTRAEMEEGSRQMGLFGDPPRKPAKREVRALMTPRSELRPLYLNTQGVRVGKSGAVLQVKDKEKVLQEVRIGEICQVSLMGNVQISTQAVQSLCEAEVPICYFSMGGWFYGITTGLNEKNVFLRRSQFRLAEEDYFARAVARRLVAGKIRNQRTLLQRNHVEPRAATLAGLKEMAERAEGARTLAELLGIEGNAARLYFGDFAGMIKPDEERAAGELAFDFEGRNRRPPRDPVNALLSLGYSLLAKDLTVACYAVGFDPYIGFYHQPRFGRPALALDLMEPFRPLVVDSAVLTAINTGMVTEREFVRVGGSVALTAGGRRGFFRAYELRMDTLVTHPLFEYRVSYRRMLEIQARLLARVLDGEIGEYPVFTTR
jgi:CRISPR-associated protein Cas1